MATTAIDLKAIATANGCKTVASLKSVLMNEQGISALTTEDTEACEAFDFSILSGSGSGSGSGDVKATKREVKRWENPEEIISIRENEIEYKYSEGKHTQYVYETTKRIISFNFPVKDAMVGGLLSCSEIDHKKDDLYQLEDGTFKKREKDWTEIVKPIAINNGLSYEKALATIRETAKLEAKMAMKVAVASDSKKLAEFVNASSLLKDCMSMFD